MALDHLASEWARYKAAGVLAKDGKHCSQCGDEIEPGEKLCDECAQWTVL